MRRLFRSAWWWSSRFTAVGGVLLAVAFVALDVRSRTATDRWLFHYTYPAPGDPPRWRWWNGGALAGGGVLKASFFLRHHTPDSIDFDWPKRTLECGHARLALSRQSLSRPARPSGAIVWLANRGLSYELHHTPWDGEASQRGLSLTAPLWMLALLSLLPMMMLAPRYLRHRSGRGFAVEPGAGSESDS